MLKIDIDYLIGILEKHDSSDCEWPQEEDDGGILAKIGLIANPQNISPDRLQER